MGTAGHDLTGYDRAGPFLAALVIAAVVGAPAWPAAAQSERDTQPGGSAASPSRAPALRQARQLGEAFVSVAERVSPAVVSVRVEARARRGGFSRFGRPPQDGIARGNGSGVVIRPDGYILTNNHVVERAERIEVAFTDRRRLPARVVGTDPATDLAVLKVEAQRLTAAPFADSRQVRVGQWAVAIGSPFGLDYTVTAGVVSSVGRGGLRMNEIEDYIQTDASINPGNSGGPLVNLDGQVIGINTMIVGRGSGIGFAIPSALARRVADQIVRYGEPRRAWIGVQFQELTPELASAFSLGNAVGALVADVIPGGPAARAGLRAGDIVTAIGGAPVRAGRDLLNEVLRHDVGTQLRLTVFRRGRALSKTLTTSARPGSPGRRPRVRSTPPLENGGPTDGLRVRGLTRDQQRELGEPGALITDVRPGSDADRAGLRPGDVVVEADGERVQNPRALNRALRDGEALLRVRRRGGASYFVLRD